MSQDTKEVSIENVSSKEADIKEPVEKQKEKPKDILEKIEKELEEKPAASEELLVIKKEEIVKLKPKSKPKPKSVIIEPPQKWEEKWVVVKGEKVLFVPSGFEIMTKNGWRPVMMKADKIQR